jgi:hypothetical protein
MKISDAHLKIQIGANLKPDSVLTGSIAAGFTSESKPAAGSRKNVLTARVIFSAAGQNVEFNAPDGTFTVSAAGTRQIETATVTAAAGATANGNLVVTLTSNKVVGSPLAVSVPLTIYNHGTEALIAAAIADKLNATPVVSKYFTATATGATVALKSLYGYANDGTLNLAIAAGLGVSAAASSANTTNGALGVIVDRPGGPEKDVFGDPWVPGSTGFVEFAVRGIRSDAAAVTESSLGQINSGETRAAILTPETGIGISTLTATGPAIAEVVGITD